MGFSDLNTETIKFQNYLFNMKLIKKHPISGQIEDIIIKRQDRLLSINKKDFELPDQQIAAHSFLFGTDNLDILSNLFATIYFDQDKSWTLLNRGRVIGKYKFDIDSFFRGLNNDNSDISSETEDLKYQIGYKISKLKDRLIQYTMMKNVALSYTSLINNFKFESAKNDYQQDLYSKLIEKNVQLQKIEEEIVRINDIAKINANFSDYIENMNLFVNNPLGDPIKVTKDTLLDYSSVEMANYARKCKLEAERKFLKSEIFNWVSGEPKEEASLFPPFYSDNKIIDSLEMSRNIITTIDKLMKELKKENIALKSIYEQKNNTEWINKAQQIIDTYENKLGIPKESKKNIFSKKIATKSGSILYKQTFIYKITFIKLLSDKLGYKLPIFCDSPKAREVETEAVNKMLEILENDFSDHQIFIASLDKFDNIFPNSTFFEVKGNFFDRYPGKNSLFPLS
jgi:hypothetical protein